MLTNCFSPVFLASNADVSTPAQSFKPLCSVISDADVLGSSFLEYNASKVICCVTLYRTGARTARNVMVDSAVVECDVAFAPFLLDSSLAFCFGNVESTKDLGKQLSSIVLAALQDAIELQHYPKCFLSINLTILQSSQDDIPALINAASLALADGAVLMKDVVSSCLFSVIKEAESNSQPCLISVSCMTELSLITHVCCKGRLDPLQLMSLLESAQLNCKSIREAMKHALLLKAGRTSA
jgi:ribonuclease PH